MKNQLASANLDEKKLKRHKAIIDSMTPQERRHPDVLKAKRKLRISAGSGTKVEDVNKLLKMHRNMADVMKMMSSGAKRGPMAGFANMLGLGGGMPMPTPEQMAELAKKMPGGLPQGLPGAGGLPPGMPGMPNMPGMPKLPGGGPGLPNLSGKPPGLGAFPGFGKKK
jgi:signal recognition particle subunit SRP54